MSSTINYNYLFKYIIIGDSSVGKSNLLLKYTQNRFNDDYQATIGVEFGAKNLDINKKVYRVQIWDTAGQENFRSITRAYYKNSACAMIVYDITCQETFKSIQSWIEDVKNQSPKTVLLILVGNKIDLEDKRQVSYEDGKALADKNDMLFFETSAKTGENVKQLFESSAKSIVKRLDEGFYDIVNESCGIKEGNNNYDNKLDVDKIKQENKNNNGCC
jgi:small GTP-binding protein